MNQILIELNKHVTNPITRSKYKKLIINTINNKLNTKQPLRLNKRLYLKYNDELNIYYFTKHNLTLELQEDLKAFHGTDIEQEMIKALRLQEEDKEHARTRNTQ
jgi:hypothetical protein